MLFAIVQVRLFLRRGLSVRYLLPTVVVDYIEQNGLYLEEGANNASSTSYSDKGNDRESIANGARKDVILNAQSSS
jgi:nicotinamide mononucleotide adenylyltransferase